MSPRPALARLAVAAFLALAPQPALAQIGEETFEIGLSTDRIGITSDFAGTRLVVFGVLDDADEKLRQQQRYDIVVALVGPRRPVVVREKERVLGLWMNRSSERFNAAPSSYALAATRPLRDLSRPDLRLQLSIGIDDLLLNTGAAGAASVAPNRDEYATALRRIRTSQGLYNQTFGTVEFISRTLFRAELQLPADLPVGSHTARAYLFRSGEFIAESSERLTVVKTGFESFVSDFATRYGTLYGLFAVALAVFTGWIGRLMFKRD